MVGGVTVLVGWLDGGWLVGWWSGVSCGWVVGLLGVIDRRPCGVAVVTRPTTFTHRFRPGRYKQIRSGEMQKGRGTGLGLSISLHIVAMHFGFVSVASQRGKVRCCPHNGQCRQPHTPGWAVSKRFQSPPRVTTIDRSCQFHLLTSRIRGWVVGWMADHRVIPSPPHKSPTVATTLGICIQHHGAFPPLHGEGGIGPASPPTAACVR